MNTNTKIINIQIGEIVTLTHLEQKIVEMVAKDRISSNVDYNVSNNGGNGRDVGPKRTEADIIGFGGEFAFCKLFNLAPDFSIGKRSVYTDKGDCTLPIDKGDCTLPIDKGIVDIKTVYKPNYNLLVNPMKIENMYVNLYCLMISEFPKFTFKGFMSREEIFKEHRLMKFKFDSKSMYRAFQDELKTIEEIYGYGSQKV